jgi:hypothetical protein
MLRQQFARRHRWSPADLFLPLAALPCHNPLRKINKQSAAGPAVAVMFCPSGMGEMTFRDKGNESASIIESDGRKVKENKHGIMEKLFVKDQHGQLTNIFSRFVH